jgi:RNA polymerase sigma factor (TIGR02999 family)
MSDVTRILEEVRRGEPGSVERLTDRLYGELRQLARRKMAAERADHTLEPTALVHELYLRLLSGEDAPSFQNRAHFFAAAAQALRRLLVEHARARARWKRGGDRQRLDVDEAALPFPEENDARVLALEAALERLAGVDAQRARIVELRFFGGCTAEEAGAALGVSESTVTRQWRLARAWLQDQLEGHSLDGR